MSDWTTGGVIEHTRDVSGICDTHLPTNRRTGYRTSVTTAPKVEEKITAPFSFEKISQIGPSRRTGERETKNYKPNGREKLAWLVQQQELVKNIQYLYRILLSVASERKLSNTQRTIPLEAFIRGRLTPCMRVTKEHVKRSVRVAPTRCIPRQTGLTTHNPKHETKTLAPLAHMREQTKRKRETTHKRKGKKKEKPVLYHTCMPNHAVTGNKKKQRSNPPPYNLHNQDLKEWGNASKSQITQITHPPTHPPSGKKLALAGRELPHPFCLHLTPFLNGKRNDGCVTEPAPPIHREDIVHDVPLRRRVEPHGHFVVHPLPGVCRHLPRVGHPICAASAAAAGAGFGEPWRVHAAATAATAAISSPPLRHRCPRRFLAARGHAAVGADFDAVSSAGARSHGTRRLRRRAALLF